MMWPQSLMCGWRQGELSCDPLWASSQTNEVSSKEIRLSSLWLMWRMGWSGRRQHSERFPGRGQAGEPHRCKEGIGIVRRGTQHDYVIRNKIGVQIRAVFLAHLPD